MPHSSDIAKTWRINTVWFKLTFFALLFFFANEGFSLGPWWHKPGQFNVADFGNALLWIFVLFSPALARKRKEVFNPISALVIFYILFATFQIILAKFNYGQSLFDGLIGIRHQFYYLSFFAFLLLFDRVETIEKLLNLLVIMGIILVLLGVINYFGPKILYHRLVFAEKIRSGITRAYIPGMAIVTLAALWSFIEWIHGKKITLTLSATIFLLAGHLLRQSRMRFVGLISVMALNLTFKKRWKPLLLLLLLSVGSFYLLEVKMQERIITNIFSTAYTDVVKKKGTMKPRLDQMRIDFEEFKKHPLFGSGLAAIRWTTEGGGSRLQILMKDLSYRSDLGYTHWIKFYGITGLIWLFLFFFFQGYYGLKVLRNTSGTAKLLAVFSTSYLLFVVVSFFTLNHLMFPWGITTVCLNAAIIVKLYWMLYRPETTEL